MVSNIPTETYTPSTIYTEGKPMKKHTTILSIITGVLLLSLSQFSQAYKEGDFILRTGAVSLQPDEQPFGTLDTLNAGLGNNTQLGITVSYMLNEHLAFGLLAATPFKHEITANGSRIGETKLLPPTFSLEFFPAKPTSKWQPYFGAGLNYTTFFSEKSTLGDLKFEDSFGLALEMGLDYQINNNLVVNATVWNIDVDTDATLNSNNIGGVNIDPWAYMISIGYIF